jgi:hypothetical protein
MSFTEVLVTTFTPPLPTAKTRTRKTAKMQSAQRVPRPPTGFSLFAETVKSSLPATVVGMCTIQKEVSSQWGRLSDEEKGKFKKQADPAWVEYFKAIGEPKKARKLENKLNGVIKRRRVTAVVGGFMKKVDSNGKRYFHNETTGMASRTKVLLVEDLLAPKAKGTATKGMTGWLVYRSVNSRKFSSDFKENSKQAGAAWKALSVAEQEVFKKRAVQVNQSASRAAAEGGVIGAHKAQIPAAESSGSESSGSESGSDEEEE